MLRHRPYVYKYAGLVWYNYKRIREVDVRRVKAVSEGFCFLE